MRPSHIVVASLCLCVGGFTCVIESQSASLTVVLTGQSMIRGDVRVYAPSAVSTISPLLKGDVVFTNFEATIAENGQPSAAAPRQGNSLSPPAAMDVLRDMGFNLFALSNNHSWDLKSVGIRNTLDEASRRSIAHAGIGNTVERVANPDALEILWDHLRGGASRSARAPGLDQGMDPP
jgi:poly-gamma-glutamate capsule biosynthesis protein CapA/YwtB (metallophosphatase superfamily)